MTEVSDVSLFVVLLVFFYTQKIFDVMRVTPTIQNQNTFSQLRVLCYSHEHAKKVFFFKSTPCVTLHKYIQT